LEAVIEKIIGTIKKEKKEKGEAKRVGGARVGASGVSRAPAIPEEVYLKALALHSLEDLDNVKSEVRSGNILIVRVGPLAEKNIDGVKTAVGELCEFTEEIGGDIARLGEERIVLTPSFVKIWRAKAEGHEISESEAST